MKGYYADMNIVPEMIAKAEGSGKFPAKIAFTGKWARYVTSTDFRNNVFVIEMNWPDNDVPIDWDAEEDEVGAAIDEALDGSDSNLGLWNWLKGFASFEDSYYSGIDVDAEDNVFRLFYSPSRNLYNSECIRRNL